MFCSCNYKHGYTNWSLMTNNTLYQHNYINAMDIVHNFQYPNKQFYHTDLGDIT